MAQIYHRYEQEFNNDLEAIKSKLNQPTQSKQYYKEIRSILSECEKNIKLMQTQLSSQSKPSKARMAVNLKDHRQQYDSIKKEIFRRQSNFENQNNKKQLLSTRPNSNQQIKTKEKSYQVNQRLKESVKVMYENLEISQNVQEQLQNQTGKMLNSKSKVVSMRDELVKSERKIKSMMLRIRKNKLVVRGVIGVIIIVFLIILVSYFK